MSVANSKLTAATRISPIKERFLLRKHASIECLFVSFFAA
jgi:hypothetical protein